MRECPACLRCYEDEVTQCPVEGRSTFHSLPGEVTLDSRYLLERRLGEGGMGVVYKAQHKFLKTTRAIKVIKPELVGNDPAFATRFQQEAMAAAAIGHPNIISVPDYGFLGGEIPFLVMEFVEGNSLQDLMSNEGKFSPEKALEYMRVIASGVGAAHAHGIVHRDLKPLNIMIHRHRTPRDGIRILDFGLAKIKSGDMFGSFVGAKTTGIIGSPYYMAPEQWSDEEPDKRCDIYSLGIILHQMLTGDVPFKGSSIPAVMKKHLMTPAPPLAGARGISEELERVVHHALEKDPKARTASAEELIAELEKAVLGVTVAVGKGAAARRRVAAKPKTPASRPRGTAAARTTAEQKKAELEEEEIARRTADQEEALRTSQPEDVQPLDGATLVVSKQRSAQREEQFSSHAAEEPIPQAETTQTLIEPEAALQSVAAEEQEEPAAVRQEENETSLKPHKVDVLFRAAEEARRRAEERALRESGADVDGLAAARVPSLAPQAAVSARFAQPLPVKKQSSLGDVVRKPLVLAAAAAALIVSVVGVYALVHFWPGPKEEPSDTSKIVSQREMPLVNGGTFTMGSDVGDENQKPPHGVTVSSFFMDKTEVTNAEYAAFVKATGHPAPVNNETDAATRGWWKPWNGTDPPAGRERWPVCNVSARDAEDFAQWLSNRDGVKYRLPTEEEWEYASRNGPTSSLFPWGNSWLDGRANLNGKSSPKDVGSFPEGATQIGLVDMVGNVWEWTSSKASFYDRHPIDPKEASAHVRRGGSFADKIDNSFYNATDRGWYGNDQYKFPTIGFRLARDAQ